MNHDSQERLPVQCAKARNPDLELTDVRLRIHKFVLSMIEGELHFQLRHGDPGASRNQIITKILGDHANRRIEQARIRMGLAPENPFVFDPAPPTFAGPQSDHDYEDVRIKLPKDIADVMEAEAQHRRLVLGVDTSRLTVMSEVLNTWANLEWHRSNMHLSDAPSNPLIVDSREVVHG